MANAFTSTDSGTLGTSLVQTAYDRWVRFKLRSTPLLRDIADVQPVQQAMPGSSVVFQMWNDLAPTTAALSETVDPDAVAIPSTTSVTVTLQEYGAAVIETRKLELTSLSDVQEGIADIIAYHMRDSLDKIVAPIITGGTNVIRANGGNLRSNLVAAGAGARASIAAGDTLSSAMIRLATAKLRGNKAVPRVGDMYMTYLHPDVSHDIRAESGNGAWRPPHEYSGPSSIWSANIGSYEGSLFVESPRMPILTDAGASNADVYQAITFGKECLAQAIGEDVHVVAGPVVDKLGRHRPLGWYGLLGFSRFREESLIRIETASSISA